MKIKNKFKTNLLEKQIEIIEEIYNDFTNLLKNENEN